jgi:hypothetical protein
MRKRAHKAHISEMRNSYKGLVKPERKEAQGKIGLCFGLNVKLIFKNIG